MKVLIFLAVLAISSVYGEELKGYKTKDTSSTATRDKLFDELFSTYKKENYPENSTVRIGLSVLNVDVCEDHDIMNMNVWIRYAWDDNRLTWDAAEKGVNVLRVPPSMVWTPDITHYNSPKPQMECAETNVLIWPNGKVLWVPPCNLKSYCNLTLSEHPYGEQTCTVKMGSWTFDGLTMGLEFFDDKKFADVAYYSGHKYKITKNVAVREEKFYDCCVEPYISTLYTFGIKRNTEAEMQCPH